MYPTTQTSHLILPATGFNNEFQKGYLFNQGGPQSRARKEKDIFKCFGKLNWPSAMSVGDQRWIGFWKERPYPLDGTHFKRGGSK
jgi:hypothetical protein